MFSTLSHKPIIGVASGFGSGVLLSFQHLLTDEQILKVVGGVGVWMGAAVACLTVLLKIIELIEKYLSNRKIKKNHE